MVETVSRRFSDVHIGDELPPMTKRITRVTLFLFGVSYFTAHRIHYDVEFSRGEGFEDVLVTANLLSAYSAQLLAQWAGDPTTLRSLEERNVAPAFAGDTLVLSGRVVGLEPAARGDGGLVRCDVSVNRTDSVRIVTAHATVQLP